MKTPIFSVIIPAYNHEKYIKEAIRSVLDQIFVDFEIIVVNDGSTDGTENSIKAFNDSRIHYFFQENHDAPFTINKGISEAKGEFIAILNSDDVFEKDKLKNCFEVLKKGADFVFGKIKVIDEKSLSLSTDDPRVSWVEEKLNNSGKEVSLEKLLLNINYLVTTSNFVFKKEIINKIGGFHEKLHYSHDFDFLLRLFANKIKMEFIPKQLVCYRMHSDNTLAKGKAEAIIEACYAVLTLYRKKGPEKNIFPKELFKIPIYSATLFYLVTLPEEQLGSLVFDLKNKQREDLKEIIWHYIQSAVEVENKDKELNNLKNLLKEAEKENQGMKNTLFWKTRALFVKIFSGLKIRKWWGTLERFFSRRVEKNQKHLERFFLLFSFPIVFLFRGIFVLKEKYFKKNNSPLVSIIIPCYNYGAYIEEAIDSVLNSTYENVEIIVIDDGPTDAYTIDLLKKLDKPKTKVFFQENQGLARARNNGIKYSKGEYILPLDADDKIDPTFIEKALYVLQRNPLRAFVYGYAKVFGAKDFIWYTGEYNLWKLKRENIIPSCSLFRKKAWKKVGGYEPDRYQYDDWTFWLKLGAGGFYGKLIPEVLFFHRKHSGEENMTERLQKKHQEYYEKIKNVIPELFNHFSDIRIVFKVLFLESVEGRGIGQFQNIKKIKAGVGKNKKLLIFLPWLSRGGAEKVSLDLIKNIKGYEIFIITTLRNYYDPMVDLEFKKVTRNVYHLASFLKEETFFPFVQSMIIQNKIDFALINHCGWAYENMKKLKENKGIKFFDLLHNTASEGYKNDSLKYGQDISKTVVISSEIKQHLIEKMGISSDKVELILNGVDLENVFSPGKIAKDEVKKEFNFPEDKKIITFIGRMSEEKNPLKFVEIAIELKKNFPEKYFFVMVGGGDLESVVKEKIKNNFGEEEFLCTGNYSYPERILFFSHVLINTSRIEGMPLTIIEALAMQVPVVAPDVGGIKEIIENGENGFLLSEKPSVEEYVQAIEALVDEKTYFGIKSKTRNSVQSFSSLKMAEKYEAMFEKVLKSEDSLNNINQ